MRQDQRAPFLTGLERAQAAACPAGEYVGQESFMRAGEIRALAHRARIGPGVSVLDLCCGVAGPGQIGTRATAGLITAHQLWSDWLGSGRVGKFAMVAEKP